MSLTKIFRSSLRPGVTFANLIFYLLAALLAIGLVVFVNSSQAFLLNKILFIATEDSGNPTGALALYDQLVSLVFVLIWGFLSDRVGRKIVYSLGFTIIGISVIAFPHVNNLYPQLLLVRLLFAVGSASTTSMLSAIFADLATDKRRGFFAGIVGLATGFGAIIAVFIFLPLPVRLEERFESAATSIRVTYGIVGGFSVAFALLLWFFLKPKSIDDSSNTAATKEKNVRSVSKQVKHAIQSSKSLEIVLGYIGGFVARADSLGFTLFITLYVNRHFVLIGECLEFDPAQETEVVKELCRAAYLRGSILSGTAQVSALVGAPVFGFLADRLSFVTSIMIAALLGLTGLVSFAVSNDPNSTTSLLPVILMGLGQIGSVVVSLALVTKDKVDENSRGAIAGAYSFSGALGILLVGRIGGALFDSWTPTAPFYLLVIAHVILLVMSIAVLILQRNQSKGQEATFAE